MSDLITLAGAVLSDAIALKSLPEASVAGAALSAMLERIMAKRRDTAREILLDELKTTGRKLDAGELEESVAILYRYARAAQEGTARLNLRLLAGVYAGQIRGRTIIADDFLYYADLLASLRRDEVILSGTLLRLSSGPDGAGGVVDPQLLQAHAIGALVPDLFETASDYLAAASALQRTGLIGATTIGGALGGGTVLCYGPTVRLAKLFALVDIEGVVAREDELAG
ncbi:hypothetical protein PQR64_26615 [Paraburkholderia phytofirmans]|uniref:hypothetical protein n=1 Tax=Paraburkholderia phytofirmans TaxID=261302 RepID=UPI0038BCDB15